MPTEAPLTYFLSKDYKTQIVAPMTDELHRFIWGRFTYGNRPFEEAELIEVDDHLEWIKHQIAIGPSVVEARLEEARRTDPEGLARLIAEAA